jgi:hypothetical protein
MVKKKAIAACPSLSTAHNLYEVQRNLFTLVVREYIVSHLTNTCAARVVFIVIQEQISSRPQTGV